VSELNFHSCVERRRYRQITVIALAWV